VARTRPRRYLGQHGLRGEAISREIWRIVAGPERRNKMLKEGIYYREPADYMPMVRRIFSGKRTRHMLIFDEVPERVWRKENEPG